MSFLKTHFIFKLSEISFKPNNKNKAPGAISACLCCITHHMFNTFWQLYRKRVREKRESEYNIEIEFYIVHAWFLVVRTLSSNKYFKMSLNIKNACTSLISIARYVTEGLALKKQSIRNSTVQKLQDKIKYSTVVLPLTNGYSVQTIFPEKLHEKNIEAAEHTRSKEYKNNKTYFVSSITSTSAGAVMGAFERPAVGSSVFSSPFVELTT